MPFLLDTNAVVTLLNDTTSGLARRARRERPSDVWLSSIVAHELFYGAFKSGRSSHNASLVDALQFAVLDFDKEDARKAGEIRAYLARRASPIGPYDVLIAGQALARDLTLVTRNTREFARVPVLKLADWEQ